MSRDEVKYYIDHMDANGLLNLCNDINEWKYKSGTLNPDCTLKHLAENLQYLELRDLEDMILDAAHEKFENLVSLLIKSKPGIYIK
jgi:hypothetical protein